ncbi:hypothetical protein ANCDUO_18254, partial [Ancylostoma duodenale]
MGWSPGQMWRSICSRSQESYLRLREKG